MGRFGEHDLGSGLVFYMDTDMFVQRQSFSGEHLGSNALCTVGTLDLGVSDPVSSEDLGVPCSRRSGWSTVLGKKLAVKQCFGLFAGNYWNVSLLKQSLPALARRSTFSFPARPACAGTHWSVVETVSVSVARTDWRSWMV